MNNSILDLSCISKKSILIIGLSGGPDSVCLLHALASLQKEYELTLIAAHLNHEWREEAGQDVLFCAQLCNTLSIPFISSKISDLHFTVKQCGSKEAQARALRRHFFAQLAQQYNATSIVLGHHAQDQQETFFIRLIRGATTAGLCCIKQKEGLYLRPLLATNKTAILQYLKKHGLSYLEDSTNSSDAYLRNRIRKYLLPALEKCDARGPEQILSTIKHMQETETFLSGFTREKFLQISDNAVLDLETFRKLDPFIQQRIISYWLCTYAGTFTLTHAFIDEINRFLLSPQGGTHQLKVSWCIVKKQNKATIRKS